MQRKLFSVIEIVIKAKKKQRRANFKVQVFPMDAFEIERCVGCGSCATVHAATWQGRRVAVKVIRNRGRKMAHAIEAETNVLSLFNHDASFPIIKMFHAIHTPRESTLVLEIAPMGNLFDVLHDGTQTLQQLRPMFESVAHGVSLLHDAGWVHGDIKLENVLLFPGQDGQRATAKLCDFSHSFRPARERMVFGRGYGTLDYMAPEAVHASRRDTTAFVSFPADVWALGIVAWEMFVSGKGGAPLFRRPSREATMDAILTFPFPSRPCPSTAILFGPDGMLQRDAEARPTAKQVYIKAKQGFIATERKHGNSAANCLNVHDAKHTC